MKGKIYVLLALDINTGDRTPKEAVVEEIAAGGASSANRNAPLHVDSNYFDVGNVEVIEVGTSLKEIKR